MGEQAINPEKQIQYTIDLTREYHNLLQKEEDSQRQSYLWDGNVAGIMSEEQRDACYYLQDELGSSTRLATEDGNVSDSYGYDEFGQDLYGNQGVVQPFGYTGYQMDKVTGNYYAQAREYLQTVAKFSTEDSKKGYGILPISMNQYTYCFNSPIILVDLVGAWPSLSDIGKVVIISVAIVAIGVASVATSGAAGVIWGAVAAGATGGATIGGISNVVAGGNLVLVYPQTVYN